MIAAIYVDAATQHIIRNTLEEQGIEVEVGQSLLLPNGDLDTNNIVILKPDEYYRAPHFIQPPKSVDGVVLTKANADHYHLYVIELKSSRRSNLNKKDIQDKFTTIFSRFFALDFAHLFEHRDYTLESLNLWVVCDPRKIRAGCASHEEFLEKVRKSSNRLRGELSNWSSTMKPFTYKQRTAMIKAVLSPPTIEINGFTDILA